MEAADVKLHQVVEDKFQSELLSVRLKALEDVLSIQDEEISTLHHAFRHKKQEVNPE